MALKKTKRKVNSKTKAKRTYVKKDVEEKYSVVGNIIAIFLAIFIAISNFSLGGGIGSVIRSCVLSFFGTFGYFFPLIIIGAVILNIFTTYNSKKIKVYSLIIIYFMLICLTTSLIIDFNGANDFFGTINEHVSRASGSFSFEKDLFSAGAFGAAVSYVANIAIGKVGSLILFGTLAIISFILLFGTKLPSIIISIIKAIVLFIPNIFRKIGERREEDRAIALENERILNETYEKTKNKKLEVTFDKSFKDDRLVLEPLKEINKTLNTSKTEITASDIQSRFFDAETDKDDKQNMVSPQSHLLKELKKKSLNEVLYEEKEKGNSESQFFYTDGMKPVDELDNIVLPKPKSEEALKRFNMMKNNYDEDETDSIYNNTNDLKSFASGLDDLRRTETIVKDDSLATLKNIEKDGLTLKNDSLKDDEVLKERIKKPRKKYKFPPISLLHRSERKAVEKDPHLNEKGAILVDTLKTFGVGATLLNITVGPAVTRYELRPDIGVKVSKILSLENDLQLALAASSLKIEAPIPGKAAIGIEIANEKSSGVLFGDMVASPEFKNSESKLTVAIGKDIGGKTVVTDLRKMPHLLIAGATGSGKSVCINSLIMSLIYKSSPEDVRLIMVDPKVVELQIYDGVPHLLIPVVTDPKKAAGALNWAVNEMTRRYNLIQEKRVRDIESYNQAIENDIGKYSASSDNEEDVEKPSKLPYIVIIIDEFADLMMVASKDVENAIMRIAQLARACGIYLVIATQRPSVNVISGSIKTNVPSRISFAVAAGIDSQTILDRRGAEKLLGHGDMLYFPVGFPEPVRVQGCYVSEEEILSAVNFVKDSGVEYDEEAKNAIDKGATINTGSEASSDSGDKDERFVEIGRYVVSEQNASIGMIQRHFAMGFNRAARIIDQLESEGVISKQDGKKPREVLMTLDEFNAKFA